MITEEKHNSELYGLKRRHFIIEDLADLRDLKERFPAVDMYYLSDCCTSFVPLEQLNKEVKGRIVQMIDKTTKTLYAYLTEKGKIKKLLNPYKFTCEVLRGYANTYVIEWFTKTEWIIVKTEAYLWFSVFQTKENGNNEYAEHIVKPVLLIPHRVQIIRTNYCFDYVNWYGGNITSYNVSGDSKDSIKEFDTALFFNKSALSERISLGNEKDLYSHCKLSILSAMPTLEKGQTANLKIDTGDTRIWLSRMTVTDGAEYDNQVEIEQNIDGKWESVHKYKAL